MVVFFCFPLCCFVSLFLVVSISAIDCLEKLVSEMTYYVSSGMLKATHTHSLITRNTQVTLLCCSDVIQHQRGL